jgi:hypothetical protein
VTERFSIPVLAPVSVDEDLRRMTDDDRLPSSMALSRFAEWAGGGRILDRTWISGEGRLQCPQAWRLV